MSTTHEYNLFFIKSQKYPQNPLKLSTFLLKKNSIEYPGFHAVIIPQKLQHSQNVNNLPSDILQQEKYFLFVRYEMGYKSGR